MNDNMRVQITADKKKKGFFRVTPHGAIDTESHDDFREHLRPVLKKSTTVILLDLKDVDYISSAGIGVLFSVKNFLKENGGDLLFCHLKPQIQKLFDVMKVLPRKTIFKSLEEADRYLYELMNEEIEKQSGRK
jgi:anti-anti-sigma factor